MFLVGISQIKNESDIIEITIRENLRVLDMLFVLDDSSEDSTPVILKSLACENLPIVLLSLQDERLKLFYDQGKSMTYLMRYALNFCLENQITDKVDYIFPLDADEIIGCNRSNLESACMSIPDYHYGLLRWRNYLPYFGEFSPKDRLIDIFRSPEHEVLNVYKSVIPGSIAFASSIKIGSHSISSRKFNISPFILENVPLLHFPVRSGSQIIIKSLIAAHKTSLRTSINSRENYHLKELANEIRASNYHLTHSHLIQLSRKYMLHVDNIPTNPDIYIDSLSNLHPLYSTDQYIQSLKSLDLLLLSFTSSRYARLTRFAFWISAKLNKIVDMVNPKANCTSFKPLDIHAKP